MDSADSRVHLAIGSQYENIELVQVVVEESLRKLDLDEETSYSIGVAVREAVANAIQHGNLENPEKRVEVDFGVENGEVVIRVTDQGSGFDPSQLVDPRAPENLLRPNGRGILFMNSYMDAIDYSFRAEGGTVVTLRKKLASDRQGRNKEKER